MQNSFHRTHPMIESAMMSIPDSGLELNKAATPMARITGMVLLFTIFKICQMET